MRTWAITRLAVCACVLLVTVAGALTGIRAAHRDAMASARDRADTVLTAIRAEVRHSLHTLETIALVRGESRSSDPRFSRLERALVDDHGPAATVLIATDSDRGRGARLEVRDGAAVHAHGLPGVDLARVPDLGGAIARSRTLRRGTAMTLPVQSSGAAPGGVMLVRPLSGTALTLGAYVVPGDIPAIRRMGDAVQIRDGAYTLVGGGGDERGWVVHKAALAGRTWTVAVKPQSPDLLVPMAIGVAGLALLGIVIAAFRMADRRERTMHDEVDSRVTQFIHAQEELEHEKDYSRAVLRALQDGLMVTDADGVVLDANRRVSEITGVPRGELVGRSAPFPFWPLGAKKRAIADEEFARVLSGDEETAEVEFARATGGRLWLALSSAVLRDDAGLPNGRVVMLKNVTAKYLAEHEREVRDNTDQLTGIANHSVFQDRLRELADTARREARDLSLVLFDIDHLKRINQLHGHRAGDEVLREASRRVLSCIRPGDLFARVGGEKFALLMPDASGDQAAVAAERIRGAVSTLPMEDVGVVTISAGVASLAQGRDGADLYRLADGARYRAKSTGRDKCVLYDPDEVSATSADEYQSYLERQGVLSTIRALARAVDAKDVTTREHSDRVASLSARIALEMGWSTHDADLLYEAGLVHDVGKIGIPDAVLFKPGRLTQDEYRLITTHAELGSQIVAGALSEEQVAWVRGHHERWNGKGYPDGLKGEEIPEGARIMALADSWDVMTIARVYSSPRTLEDAVEECLREAGEQFWPPAVKVLERLVRDGLVRIDTPDPVEMEIPPTPARDDANLPS